jgi:hypothetical protein
MVKEGTSAGNALRSNRPHIVGLAVNFIVSHTSRYSTIIFVSVQQASVFLCLFLCVQSLSSVCIFVIVTLLMSSYTKTDLFPVVRGP